MPREITHWIMLERGLKAAEIEGLSLASDIIEQNRAATYLGALGQDIPYYYDFGQSLSAAQAGDRLHGLNGEDTLQPIRRLYEKTQYIRSTKQSKSIIAFIMGMLTHIHVDATFHPLINYYSGNWSEQDTLKRSANRRRHKLLEVYLDSWFIDQLPLWNENKISVVVNNNDVELEAIATLLGSEIPIENSSLDVNKAAWQKSIKQMALLKGLFRSDLAGFLAKMATYLLPLRLSENEALFSYRRREKLSCFSKDIQYLNPYSGENFTHNLKNLENTCTERIRDSLLQFEKVLQGAPFDQIFSPQAGISLDYGIYGAKSTDAQTFSLTPLI